MIYPNPKPAHTKHSCHAMNIEHLSSQLNVAISSYNLIPLNPILYIRFCRSTLILIFIKPLAIFPPKPLRIHHSLQEHAGAVLGVARAFVECLLDREAGV